jgi:hypothetical protein
MRGKRFFCRFFTTMSLSVVPIIHTLVEFDRAIGRFGQIAAQIFAIKHLDVLPHAERGADLGTSSRATLSTEILQDGGWPSRCSG